MNFPKQLKRYTEEGYMKIEMPDEIYKRMMVSHTVPKFYGNVPYSPFISVLYDLGLLPPEHQDSLQRKLAPGWLPDQLSRVTYDHGLLGEKSHAIPKIIWRIWNSSYNSRMIVLYDSPSCACAKVRDW